MLKVEFDTKALLAGLDKLGKTIESAARPAAQAGAQVFYDEVRARVPVGVEVHATKGKKHVFQPGNLKAAIYQVYDREVSTAAGATYEISWNKRKAFYGRFVERGTSKMPARPFLRPAYDAARDRAIAAVQSALAEQLKASKAP